MRVLVTGAAGFIGSHTCETILKDKRIKKLVGVDHLKDGSLRNLKNIIKNRKFHFKKIDIRDRRLFPKLFKKIDVIIHLAAVSDIVPSIKYPSEYLDVNFNGTLNILENMRRFSVKKIIFSASSSCYGIPKNFPTSEKEKISPKYPYAFSKYISEQLIIHWSNVYKINYLSLRLDFWLGAGTDFTSGSAVTGWESTTNANRAKNLSVNLADNTANNWYITGLQLEVGSQATAFEHRSFGEELALCQRYYYRWTPSAADDYVGVVQAYSSGAVFGIIRHLPVTMRATPTGSASGTWKAVNSSGSTSNTGSFTGTNVNKMNKNSIGFDGWTGASNLSGGNAVVILENSGSGYLDASAEL